MEILGITLDVLGTILIALMALRVHHNVMKEQRIDPKVFKEMRHEQILGLVGVIFLVIGYFLQIFSKVF